MDNISATNFIDNLQIYYYRIYENNSFSVGISDLIADRKYKERY